MTKISQSHPSNSRGTDSRGYIMTFSDLKSIIEWNEANLKQTGTEMDGIAAPMALLSPNSLLHPTSKVLPKMEHLMITKMTSSWDKNHCLKWRKEMLRIAFTSKTTTSRL